MGRWLEHTVETYVKASVDRVWFVWSDLEAMPLWMSWIESVKTIDETATRKTPDTNNPIPIQASAKANRGTNRIA